MNSRRFTRSPHRRGRATRRGDFDAEGLRGDQVDDEIKFRRLLHREVGGLRPAKDLVDIVGGAPVQVQKVGP